MLTGFLQQDPENEQLLLDTADAALTADQPQQAAELLHRLEALRPLSDGENNVAAIAAMRAGQADAAADGFARLRAGAPDDPALSFNHAWALALAGRREEAAAALSQEAIAQLPQAAMLEVQLAHLAGDFDQGIALARAHLQTHPGYPPLLAATSLLAMDMDDPDLARETALAAGDHPDAWTTLGLLHIGDSEPGAAREMLARTLALQPRAPRAIVGMGLADMIDGDLASAANRLDDGAAIFGDHLGSWIAAGWSYLLAGDAATARARFEHCLALDDTFAEIHGSLAVLDVLDGSLDAAQKKADVAMRLDRQCFSGSFATMLLSAGGGDQDKAARILELALRQPLGNSGRTLGEAIARMAV